MSKSFKGALTQYAATPHPADKSMNPPRLSRADRAHLERWAADGREDEIWNRISNAAKENGVPLPVRFFIQEVLGARDVASSINHRRNNRELYLKRAARMAEIAKALRTPLPNGFLLVPKGKELAMQLDEAAQTYRAYVAVARKETPGMTWTRMSKPMHVFIGLVSRDLRGITGKWLDYEVAVLTEIAFDERDIDPKRVLWARNPRKRGRRTT
jgi:hypothetical protein